MKHLLKNLIFFLPFMEFLGETPCPPKKLNASSQPSSVQIYTLERNGETSICTINLYRIKEKRELWVEDDKV